MRYEHVKGVVHIAKAVDARSQLVPLMQRLRGQDLKKDHPKMVNLVMEEMQFSPRREYASIAKSPQEIVRLAMVESRPSSELEPTQASFEKSLLAQQRLNSPPSITSGPRPEADLKNAGPEPIPIVLE
jgi:hypothetical protein